MDPTTYRRLNIARLTIVWLCLPVIFIQIGVQAYKRFAHAGFQALLVDVTHALPLFGDIGLSLGLLLFAAKAISMLPTGVQRTRMRWGLLAALVIVFAWWAGVRMVLSVV